MRHRLHTDHDNGWLTAKLAFAQRLGIIDKLSPESRINKDNIHIHYGDDLELFLIAAYNAQVAITITQYISSTPTKIRGYASVETIQSHRNGSNGLHSPDEGSTLACLESSD